MVRAQDIGAYGSVGGNGTNGRHRSSGAGNIINLSCSGNSPKIASLNSSCSTIGPSCLRSCSQSFIPRSCLVGNDSTLLHFDDGIFLDIFFVAAPIVSACSRIEIHVIPDNSRTPRCRNKLWECTFSSLVGSQRCNQSITIKLRNVYGSSHERCSLCDYGSVIHQVQALTRWQKPKIPLHARLPKHLR
jgi:hypothetical protein